MTQMRSSISRIRNRLNLAKLLLILALLFITYPPAMKAWESADSIPEEYSRIEYLMKEIDQYLPLVAVMGLLIFTTAIISIIVLIVSYIPSRRIAKMKPTDALRGKITA